MNDKHHSITHVGWREWVRLPGIGVDWIKVKVDTGARSSALHAFNIEELDEGERVRFQVHPWQLSERGAVTVECPIADRRTVRSSSGHTQERIVVLLEVVLAGQTITAETTLTNRDQMGFRMLVGREALRQGFLVDPAQSFLGGRPPAAIRRANRGKR